LTFTKFTNAINVHDVGRQCRLQ